MRDCESFMLAEGRKPNAEEGESAELFRARGKADVTARPYVRLVNGWSTHAVAEKSRRWRRQGGGS